MDFKYIDNCKDIDWERVRNLLKTVGMSFVDADRHKLSFENSYSVLFVYDGDEIVGMGRLISDGVRQSAAYDMAIDPHYQRKGLGKTIMQKLMATTPGCTFILYASPGKEDFYRSLGFKKMKTGMILFTEPDRMTNSPFINEE